MQRTTPAPHNVMALAAPLKYSGARKKLDRLSFICAEESCKRHAVARLGVAADFQRWAAFYLIQMSKVSLTIVLVAFGFLALIIALIVVVRFGAGSFITDAAFQDCLTVEAMVPMKSENDINAAIRSCATSQGVHVRNVNFSGSISTGKITAIVTYSLPVAGFTLNRNAEKTFRVDK